MTHLLAARLFLYLREGAFAEIDAELETIAPLAGDNNALPCFYLGFFAKEPRVNRRPAFLAFRERLRASLTPDGVRALGALLESRTEGDECWSKLTEDQREAHRERVRAALRGKPMYAKATIDGVTYFATSGGYCRESGDYLPDVRT